jgi:hypothetical protein
MVNRRKEETKLLCLTGKCPGGVQADSEMLIGKSKIYEPNSRKATLVFAREKDKAMGRPPCFDSG